MLNRCQKLYVNNSKTQQIAGSLQDNIKNTFRVTYTHNFPFLISNFSQNAVKISQRQASQFHYFRSL
jgi:hypothetical protein